MKFYALTRVYNIFTLNILTQSQRANRKDLVQSRKKSGPGCSKLTISNVNKYLKYANVPICFVETLCEAFTVQKLLSFFQQKNSSVFFFIKW